MNELKTPAEWCMITGIIVVDPDGWDRKLSEGPGSWYEPCTEEEFRRRAWSSTVIAWPTEDHSEA